MELIEALEAVESGEIERLAVFMPPRHGKSETVSRLFPAWYLYRHPDEFVGLNSYSAELAYTLSRNARENYVKGGGGLKDDAAAVKHWETGFGGGLWAAGVGGSITGKGFHVGIIDDPLRNAEDAASQLIRDKQFDWWQSTYYTRAEPGARMIHVQTRWHQDDLAGRVLPLGDWHVIKMPAIREEGGRMVALCPERYPVDELLTIKKQAGQYNWSALYQQEPTPLEGGMWKRDWFQSQQLFDEPPKNLRSVGYDWDTAYTKNERNSATAYVKSGIDAERNVYILDAGFKWVETPTAEAWMQDLRGPHYVEAKASGKSIVQTLKSRGVVAIEVSVPGGADKEARTSLATPIAESGKLYVSRTIVNMLLDDERQGILKFPNASHDDLNDALVQAIHRHLHKKPPAVRFSNTPI